MADRPASTNREIPVAKSYVFLAELLQEEDGRWSAGVPSLPGCATWGHTREEALRNLRDAVEAYIRDVHEAGGEIPQDAPAQVRDEPLVAIHYHRGSDTLPPYVLHNLLIGTRWTEDDLRRLRLTR